MNINPLLAVLLIATQGFAQCPFPAQLNTTGSCLGATLSVSTSNTLTKIVWYNGSATVATSATIPPNATYAAATAGVYTAEIGDNTGCQITTNAIIINPMERREHCPCYGERKPRSGLYYRYLLCRYDTRRLYGDGYQ